MKNLMLLCSTFALLLLWSCEKNDRNEALAPEPSISCGQNWTTDCIQENWLVNRGAEGNLLVSLDSYGAANSLLMVSPYDSFAPNHHVLKLNTFIKNVKENSTYKVSFYSKISGYLGYPSNPSLAAYVTGDFDQGGGWYNEMYYYSPVGEYHTKDWSEHSFTFMGKDEPTLNFELYSAYDSTWISNLKIEEF